MNLSEQLHIGLWLITWQLVFKPQVPGHGSTHFLFIHASNNGHSVLTIHSGLHPGDEKRYYGKQEQNACPLI